MLITHFIGLAMGLGTSFSFVFLGITASKMEKEDAMKFSLHAFALSKMGNVGLVLLFISGGYLMTPYWGTLAESPTLIIKLGLFLALGAFLGIIGSKVKRAKAGDMENQLPKIKKMGQLALVTSLTIVILAVITFH